MDIEIGANRTTLLDIAKKIQDRFSDSFGGESSIVIPFNDGEISIGNEDMEREDVDDGEVYVDIS